MATEKQKKRKDLTHVELLALLDYNELTGDFTRLVTVAPNAKAGDVAGTVDYYGYIIITINYKRHRANRLAWFYKTKSWPESIVEHEDRNRANNIWTNLRLATQSENLANIGKHKDNTSGYKGVTRDKQREKWYAQIMYDGKTKFLGRFDNIIEAARAYDRGAKKYHSEEYAYVNFPDEWDGLTYMGHKR